MLADLDSPKALLDCEEIAKSSAVNALLEVDRGAVRKHDFRGRLHRPESERGNFMTFRAHSADTALGMTLVGICLGQNHAFEVASVKSAEFWDQ
jgi:hypothetical protein